MPDQANEFFGEDFGVAQPVGALPEQKPQSKGVINSALEFFGMDFTTPKPQYKNEAAPQGSKASKFETVFSALTTQESQNKHTDAQGNLTTSPKGAQGITQVMPKVGKDPGFGVEPLKDKSEKEYLRFGRDYLKAMLKEFGGDYEKALAAYNAGYGNVQKAIKKGGEDWKSHLPKAEETLPYIDKILRKK